VGFCGNSVKSPTLPGTKAQGGGFYGHLQRRSFPMGRGILLWLVGVPIPIIILILIFWH